MLAECLREHPVELRADLQRHFGLNLDDMGRTFSAFHAAACLACMPRGSLLAKIDQRTEWTITDVLLHNVVDVLCGKHIPFPWEDKPRDDNLPDLEALPLDEFAAWYSCALSNTEGGEPWQIV